MIPVLIGLGILIGGVAIVANWDSIVNWLNDFIPKLEAKWKELRADVPHDYRIYGDLVVEGGKHLISIIHELFYKDEDGNWLKQSTTRKIPEDEVPEAIRMSIKKQEAEKKQKADITDEMKPLLTMENSN